MQRAKQKEATRKQERTTTNYNLKRLTVIVCLMLKRCFSNIFELVWSFKIYVLFSNNGVSILI